MVECLYAVTVGIFLRTDICDYGIRSYTAWIYNTSQIKAVYDLSEIAPVYLGYRLGI